MQVRFGVLNAGNFGVSQSRKRTFIWGVAPGSVLPEWPQPLHVFRSPQLTIKLPGGAEVEKFPPAKSMGLHISMCVLLLSAGKVFDDTQKHIVIFCARQLVQLLVFPRVHSVQQAMFPWDRMGKGELRYVPRGFWALTMRVYVRRSTRLCLRGMEPLYGRSRSGMPLETCRPS